MDVSETSVIGQRSPATLRGVWPALAGLSAVFLFEMLDNSVLNVALPTIGRELHASTVALTWVVNAYAVLFGSLMLVFGAIADRSGRRRVMLVGLLLLAVASLATAAVRTPEQLIAVRALMGVAAAMTTPGSIALTFRLFADDRLRVRAMTLVSTVGLVGLAVGPTLGGLVLAVAPWQVLLLANAPVAVLALVGIRAGIPADAVEDLHRSPIDVAGALLGTGAVLAALSAPNLFADGALPSAWATTAAAAGLIAAFLVRQRIARDPLVDPALVARPLVSAGLAYKAASGLIVAGMSYLVTLQLQLDWGWPPALAAIGMLPQVVVLVAGGSFVSWFTDRVGLDRAAWMSAGALVAGILVFALLGRFGYPFVAAALVLEALGIRVNGVVAGVNVLKGLPKERSSIGAALVDTASQVASGVGIAVAGTLLAALVGGSIATGSWDATRAAGFEQAVVVAGVVLACAAAALSAWAFARTRRRSVE